MFFEGSEKKIEVVVDAQFESLRSFSRKRWEELVEAAGAQILSHISTDQCDAYLLSESSLFVFDSRMVLITCGRTQMVPAVRKFLEWIPQERVDAFFFERKNELFPQFQGSHFYQDAEELAQLMPGKAFRFGEETGMHLFTFYLDRKSQQLSNTQDRTTEVLMHEIHSDVRSVFLEDKEKIREFIFSSDFFAKNFSDFILDDHCFEPMGYSLNAIRGADYFTFHVTPEEKGSYVSFETNVLSGCSVQELSDAVVTLFRPKSWNIVATQADHLDAPISDKVSLTNEIVHRCENSYALYFSQYQIKDSETGALALELPRFEEAQPETEPVLPSKEPSEYADWVMDPANDDFVLGFKKEKLLFSGQSDFQKIEVYKTRGHGNILLNDGITMLSERDEFIYHEMIAHVPLFVHPHPTRVLIIGGGDCGTAREVLRHSSVSRCLQVEIDQMVVDACKDHFSWVDETLKDSRMELLIEDGVKFVAQSKEQFDVVIVDSTDPIGPGAPLFGPQFYSDLKSLLSPGGIVVSQGESPFYFSKMQSKLSSILNSTFKGSYFYNYSNLTYPGGLWSFSFASDVFNPVSDFHASRVGDSGLGFRYYNPQIHCSAFFLPEFMKENLDQKL